jgi:hypothetical protein
LPKIEVALQVMERQLWRGAPRVLWHGLWTATTQHTD